MKMKKVPMRRCLGCQGSKPQKELIRIVKTPEGALCVDATGKMNGRGAYICPDAGCLAIARKTKRLEQQFKTDISDELFAQLNSRIQEFNEKIGGETHGK
jgi:predicted RNA-binding protein YlxR (DUF448 family)